jgi:hypothetical protein
MTEMYYNIVFKSDNGDIWTYQDDYGRDAAFYSLKDAKEKIKEFFKDPLVVEATIYAIAEEPIYNVKNEKQEVCLPQ